MAKYCIKCGKPLPEGVEICPDCNKSAGSDGAALFTMMTAETEVWKESGEDERKRERAKALRNNKPRILIGSAAVLVVALSVFIVLFTQAGARVTRALDKGEFDKALSIYSEKLSDEEPSKGVQKALLEAAEAVREDFAQWEMSEDEAKATLATLSAFGGFTDQLLGDVQSDMKLLYASHAAWDEAERCLAQGDYLAAAAASLEVAETDSRYQVARENAENYFERYADNVVSQASGYISEGDYINAVTLLREASDKLLEYDTFSQKIDDKIVDCCNLYEAYILVEAEHLAENEEYTAAAELIRGCIEDFDYETEALISARESYLLLAEGKVAGDAVAKATEEYEALRYAAAFETLDSALEALPEGDARGSLEQAILAMEELFVLDIIAEAESIYGGDRDNLTEAIAKLERAHVIRQLDGLEEKREALEELLPLELVSADYSAKDDEVYRISNKFKALDGSAYANWLWGRNEASVSYALEGAYDEFTATFAIRRESDKSMTGWFEIWLDGEKAYTSEELSHDSESFVVPISLDISGVQELKIVFFCDYESSSAENGYSYHGLCEPECLKAEK